MYAGSRQRTRMAFGVLLQQYGNAAHLISNFVGGEYMHRDHRGDPNGRDPLEPVKGDKQREALKFLQEHILSDKAFQFPPELGEKLFLIVPAKRKRNAPVHQHL